MIAEHIQGRSVSETNEKCELIQPQGKQCRDRWMNHLAPDIKKSPWTPEEDNILLTGQQKWGNAWSKIAQQLPGKLR
jgi:hypothetical protein